MYCPPNRQSVFSEKVRFVGSCWFDDEPPTSASSGSDATPAPPIRLAWISVRREIRRRAPPSRSPPSRSPVSSAGAASTSAIAAAAPACARGDAPYPSRAALPPRRAPAIPRQPPQPAAPPQPPQAPAQPRQPPQPPGPAPAAPGLGPATPAAPARGPAPAGPGRGPAPADPAAVRQPSQAAVPRQPVPAAVHRQPVRAAVLRRLRNRAAVLRQRSRAAVLRPQRPAVPPPPAPAAVLPRPGLGVVPRQPARAAVPLRPAGRSPVPPEPARGPAPAVPGRGPTPGVRLGSAAPVPSSPGPATSVRPGRGGARVTGRLRPRARAGWPCLSARASCLRRARLTCLRPRARVGWLRPWTSVGWLRSSWSRRHAGLTLVGRGARGRLALRAARRPVRASPQRQQPRLLGYDACSRADLSWLGRCARGTRAGRRVCLPRSGLRCPGRPSLACSSVLPAMALAVRAARAGLFVRAPRYGLAIRAARAGLFARADPGGGWPVRPCSPCRLLARSRRPGRPVRAPRAQWLARKARPECAPRSCLFAHAGRAFRRAPRRGPARRTCPSLGRPVPVSSSSVALPLCWSPVPARARPSSRPVRACSPPLPRRFRAGRRR